MRGQVYRCIKNVFLETLKGVAVLVDNGLSGRIYAQTAR
jgi:hypothetical protein